MTSIVFCIVFLYLYRPKIFYIMTGKIVVKATQQQQQHGGTGNGWKDPNRSKLSNEQNPTHLGAKLQTMPGGGMPVGMTMQLPHPNGSGNIMVPNADTIANMN